jgi:sugar lactone lactonase YvrE
VGRGAGLFGLLCVVSLGSASSAGAAACGLNPVCPYQAIQVLGDSDPASLDRPLAVAEAPNGDVVVADGMKQSVREFTATGQLVRQIGTPGEIFPGISGVAVSPTNGEIWESDTTGTRGFAADGTPNAFIGGPNSVPLVLAGGVAVSPSGNVYIFSWATSSVFEYSPTGALLTSWPATNVPASDSEPIAVDAEGNVYLGASALVREFNSAGSQVATFSMPSSVTTLAVYGSALYAQLDTGVGEEIATYDLSGNLTNEFPDPGLEVPTSGATFAVGASGIVAATTDHTIQDLTLQGTLTGTWGGLANDDFQATYALGDAAGNAYVLDGANARVIRYDAQGDPPTVFADLSAYGAPTLASFDSEGDLVVSAGSDLVTLSPTGSVISTASNASNAPDGTPLANVPPGAENYATDSAGDFYVDSYYGTAAVPLGYVGKYSPTGQLLEKFNVGTGWVAGIPGPLAVDSSGRIYVATNMNDIREFDPAGNLIAVWPSPQPRSISVAPNGDLYVTAGATVIRFDRFLDPLPPIPSTTATAPANPVNQSKQATIALALAKQPATRSLGTTLTCTGSPGVSCVGMLVLSAKTQARTSRGKSNPAPLVLLGSKTFSIPVGHRVSESVRLGPAARRLLATHRTVDATLTASYRAGATSSTITRRVVLRGHPRKRTSPRRRGGRA